ncbi:hypothetical protein AGR7B_Lc50270 [Agrobacterium deltaense RV3]|nr:hypothetical protein AGR7B_Lc50270 [Agrobacterium deltaense RV3]
MRRLIHSTEAIGYSTGNQSIENASGNLKVYLNHLLQFKF